jgi:hypothetical protein
MGVTDRRTPRPSAIDQGEHGLLTSVLIAVDRVRDRTDGLLTRPLTEPEERVCANA